MINEKSISEFVDAHRDEALDCLSELVRAASPTGKEEPAVAAFKSALGRAGLQVRTVSYDKSRENLLAEWFGTRPGKRFIFNGHMDVFPPDPADPGKFGPWSGKIEGGFLYGRGSCDMKGGDAGAIMAVAFLKRMGFDPKGSVLLSFMVDEENGGKLGVQSLVRDGHLKGDFGICMEPTSGGILLSHNGILRGNVTYTGQAQSTSFALKGKSALEKALTAISALYAIKERMKDAEPAQGLLPNFTVSVISAGDENAVNVYPTLCRFWFDRRLKPGETHGAALKEITDILDGLQAKDPAFKYEIEITSRRPSLHHEVDDPFVRLLTESYEQVLGKKAFFKNHPGGSDAAYIRQDTGMPMPNFGGADDDTEPCTANEKISVQNYLDFIKVYMMVLVNALS